MGRQFQWLSADGQQLIDLTDRTAGYRMQADGTTGLNAPPYRIATSQYAGIDGVTFDAVSAGEREVVLGLLIQGAGDDELEERVAALTRAMRPKAGPGTLTVTNAAGRARTLTCLYQSGLEGIEARGAKLPGHWWKFAVHLLAADPWFYGPQRTLSVGLGAPTQFFPIFPLVLSSSQVQGQFTVDLSDTDSPAHPVWTIIGPGTYLALTNVTTGQVIEVNASLTAGQTMTIDTRPGVRSVRRDDGTNLVGSLVGDPAMWPLVESVNEVTAALTGATVDSRIIGEFRPRYAGA